MAEVPIASARLERMRPQERDGDEGDEDTVAPRERVERRFQDERPGDPAARAPSAISRRSPAFFP